MVEAGLKEKKETRKAVHPTDRILCAACGETITRARHAISRRDAHRHTVFNPMGQLFEIRCFAVADCINADPPYTEFSWFPGYSWQMAHCSGCGAQVGWYYRAPGDAFYGLIANRLVDAR